MIETIPDTGSTNADLVTRLRAGEALPEGFWLRAEVQTSGRGRAGRQWVGERGNLYCSTLVHLVAGDPPAQTLSLVTGLAVHDVLRAQLPGAHRDREEQRWLKWPNDVLYEGAKISGILCERTGDAVVVGIGINVAQAPSLPDRSTISIHKISNDDTNDAAAVLETLTKAFATRLHRWRSEPLATTFSEWEVRAHRHGTPMLVRDAGLPLTGTFAGLAPTGALLLRLPDGTTSAIHAGDVTLENE